MVTALGPGKFYGSSLPRPRFYDKEDRVDPPVSVLDPLLSWANEAHWSMGGLSFKRLRLQGKIEGNIEKLRKEKEKEEKEKVKTPVSQSKKRANWEEDEYEDEEEDEEEDEDEAPPAPRSKKTRRRMRVVDEEESDDGSEEVEDEVVRRKRRRLVRKLGDDFDMVVNEDVKVPAVARRTRSRRSVVVDEDEDESEGGNGSVSPKKVSKKSGGKGFDSSSNGTRSSPRLKKKSS